MTDKQIKKLSKVSFVRGAIDPKRVLRIAKFLKRSELRKFLKYLKIQIELNRVHVQVPDLKNTNELEMRKQFSKLYPDKKIIIEQNPDLLLGMRIIDNDRIYDFNLKDSFENISKNIENYD